MGEVPESAVSIPELLALSQQWPPVVLSHMGWRQQELEEMRSAAKQQFRQSRPSSCVYCGSLITSDMYRHVARFHLDLAQLWRCPVSWCTIWKGTPQDCMDHLRGSHNVPWEVKSASLEKFLPPWTVSRKVWSEALSAQHSGISTDVLLFSDIHLSLVHIQHKTRHSIKRRRRLRPNRDSSSSSSCPLACVKLWQPLNDRWTMCCRASDGHDAWCTWMIFSCLVTTLPEPWLPWGIFVSGCTSMVYN